MLVKLLFSATLAGSVLAATDLCGAGEPSAEFKSAVNALRIAERTKSTTQHLHQNTVINIPVWLHAIVNSTVGEEYLNDEVLSSQVDTLTDRFEPYDITFELAGTSRTVDDELSQGLDNPSFNNFKLTNRKGDLATLNLYFVTNMDETTGGSCTFPSPGMDLSNPITRLDGCVLQGYSVPGGTGYLGRTFKGEIAVHEVGHWLGLVSSGSPHEVHVVCFIVLQLTQHQVPYIPRRIMRRRWRYDRRYASSIVTDGDVHLPCRSGFLPG